MNIWHERTTTLRTLTTDSTDSYNPFIIKKVPPENREPGDPFFEIMSIPDEKGCSKYSTRKEQHSELPTNSNQVYLASLSEGRMQPFYLPYRNESQMFANGREDMPQFQMPNAPYREIGDCDMIMSNGIDMHHSGIPNSPSQFENRPSAMAWKNSFHDEHPPFQSKSYHGTPNFGLSNWRRPLKRQRNVGHNRSRP